MDSAQILYIHYQDSFPDTMYLRNEIYLFLYYNTESYDSVYVTEKLLKHDCYETVNVPDSVRVFKIDSVGNEVDYSNSFSFGSSDNLIGAEIEPYHFADGPIVPIKLTGKLPSDNYSLIIKHYKDGKMLFYNRTRSVYLRRE
jgi:hypothetical protein